MKKLVYPIFLVLSYCLNAQNLVRNPSFEEFIKCPESEFPSPRFNGYVKDWYSKDEYSNEGPGRFECKDCYKNFLQDSFYWHINSAKINPQEGKAMISAAWFSISNPGKKRFYYFSLLKEPLKKGQTYRVSYFVHFNKNFNITDHVGLTFINDTTQIYKDGNSYLTTDFIGIRDSFLGPDSKWHKIQGCYEAKGGEKWILLGNFLQENEIHNLPNYAGTFSQAVSTLMIDNISVEPATSQIVPDQHYEICDETHFEFPPNESPSVVIKDADGHLVNGVNVVWPEKYSFYSWDDCFGKLNTITVNSKICENRVNLERSICIDEALDVSTLLSKPFGVVDNLGQQLSDFKSPVSGKFDFKVYHDRYGEFGSLSIDVLDCKECKMNFASVFSPLAVHPENRTWRPLSNCSLESYSLQIFNRWGMLVYESRDPQASWNGYIGTQLGQEGVYVYTVAYEFKIPGKPSQKRQAQGDFLLTY